MVVDRKTATFVVAILAFAVLYTSFIDNNGMTTGKTFKTVSGPGSLSFSRTNMTVGLTNVTYKTKCTDSDGGVAYYDYGVVKQWGPSGGTWYDKCISSNKLEENYCTIQNKRNYVHFDCPIGYSCSNGECIVNESSNETMPDIWVNNFSAIPDDLALGSETHLSSEIFVYTNYSVTFDIRYKDLTTGQTISQKTITMNSGNYPYTFTADYTTILPYGQHRLSVEADVYNVINESMESNNNRTTEIIVAYPNPEKFLIFVSDFEGAGKISLDDPITSVDRNCNYEADDKGYNGTYIGWLSLRNSTDTINAGDRLGNYFDGYGNIFGQTVADNKTDLLDGSLDNSIMQGAPYSRYVWTGTSANGTATGYDCNGWTSGSSPDRGTSGNVFANDSSWTDIYRQYCSSEKPFYCFQVY